MIKNYYFLLFVFCITVSWGQTKSSVNFHITKDYLENINSITASNDKQVKSNTEVTSELQKDSLRLINFNPAISFTSDEDTLTITRSIDDLSKATIFTVYQSDAIKNEREIWGIYEEESEVTLTTKEARNSNKKLSYGGGISTIPILHTYAQQYNPEENQTPVGTEKILLGKFSDKVNVGFRGVIAEVIVYNELLRGKKRRIVESALALKYGITLTHGKNYLSSKNKKVWRVKDNVAFGYRIAGIGRDDDMGVYQKQSQSTALGNLITIGVGEVALSNKANNAVLEDQTFLIWGDNNNVLTLEKEEEVADLNRVPMLKRRWKIQATGKTTQDIKTSLHVDVNKIFPEPYELDKYLLVVDQSGSGKFLPQDNKHFEASSLLDNGKITFEGIQWDEDGSGSDVFGFSVLSELTLDLTEGIPENCEIKNNGVLLYEVKGGVPPYDFELSIAGEENNKQWRSTNEAFKDQRLEKLATGNYTLTVTDVMGKKTSSSYELVDPKPISINLGPDRRLSFLENTRIEASITNTAQEATYEWTSDNGFASRGSIINVNKPGTYTVTATSSKGCTAIDEIKIFNSYIQSFSVLPNISKDGKFQVFVSLEAEKDISIEVYDMMGKLLNITQRKNQSSYTVDSQINPVSGVYVVVLKIGEEKTSHKLIIK